MKEDERFMAGSPAITREIAVYLVAFFSAIAASALSAHLNWSWDGAMRFLAALTGA